MMRDVCVVDGVLIVDAFVMPDGQPSLLSVRRPSLEWRDA